MATPRATSPRASDTGVPTSRTTRLVISAARCSRAFAASDRALARAAPGVSRQPAAALTARPTAAWTSAGPAGCHSPRTSFGSWGLTLVKVIVGLDSSVLLAASAYLQQYLAPRRGVCPQARDSLLPVRQAEP